VASPNTAILDELHLLTPLTSIYYLTSYIEISSFFFNMAAMDRDELARYMDFPIEPPPGDTLNPSE
jgi:hypothetical protein